MIENGNQAHQKEIDEKSNLQFEETTDQLFSSLEPRNTTKNKNAKIDANVEEPRESKLAKQKDHLTKADADAPKERLRDTTLV